MIDKIDKDLTGVEITDELHSNVGSAAFALDHDTILDNVTLDVWTGSSKSGTQLTQGSDYVLDTKHSGLSSEASNDVYLYIQVTNGTYQSGDLYFYYDTVGDFVEATDVNDLLPLDGTRDMNGGLTVAGIVDADNTIVEHNLDVSSPSNGYYVRWDNGLQVCWITDITATATATINSPIHFSDTGEKYNWTFPASFSIIPGVWANGQDVVVLGTAPNITASDCNIGIFSDRSRTDILVDATAIGRWK